MPNDTPNNNHQQELTPAYTDDNIRHLSDMEHVRTDPACISAGLVTAHCLKTVSTCC